MRAGLRGRRAAFQVAHPSGSGVAGRSGGAGLATKRPLRLVGRRQPAESIQARMFRAQARDQELHLGLEVLVCRDHRTQFVQQGALELLSRAVQRHVQRPKGRAVCSRHFLAAPPRVSREAVELPDQTGVPRRERLEPAESTIHSRGSQVVFRRMQSRPNRRYFFVLACQ